jgi:hypothetical protein
LYVAASAITIPCASIYPVSLAMANPFDLI